MDCHNPENMDRTIRSMLGAEPLRPVPSGFGRKVKTRVTLTAMLDWERQTWRHLKAFGLFGVILASAFIAVPVIFPRALELILRRAIPGGAGYADYVLSLAWYGGYSLAVSLGFAALGSLGAAIAVRHVFQRIRSWSPMGRS